VLVFVHAKFTSNATSPCSSPFPSFSTTAILRSKTPFSIALLPCNQPKSIKMPACQWFLSSEVDN